MFKKRLTITIVFFSLHASADFEFFRGVRQMGMGGASIAVVNDETAVLSNPNGLGKLRDYFFTVIDPEITASTSARDPLIGTGILGAVSPETLYNEMLGFQEQPFYMKTQIFPSVVLPNFGIGLLGRYEILAQRNPDGTLDYNYQNDYSLNLAYNMRFWGGRIKWGFAGRLINRSEFFGTRDPVTESLSTRAFLREGMGISVDSGLTLAAPWAWIPTLTIYIRDIGGTSFTAGGGIFGNNSNGTPQSVRQTIDVAVAAFPIFGRNSRGALTIEYTDIENINEADDIMDQLRIGGEYNFMDMYFIRLGYHQNDWTAGFEYSYGQFQWQLATYSELVTFATTTERDRRGILKFTFRF